MASFGSFYPQVMWCRDASLAAPQKEAGGELVMSAEKCQLPVWMFFKKTDFWTEQVCEYWMRQNQSQKEALRGEADPSEKIGICEYRESPYGKLYKFSVVLCDEQPYQLGREECDEQE